MILMGGMEGENILKDTVYRRKPTTLAAFREEIENACASNLSEHFGQRFPSSSLYSTHKCLEANGNHFAYLL
ncbi:hypothetical protein M0802_005655 [Mischocyttarus mexicanus]|nr:hypothetical protein M0802_005655 [Mischocyttarus mexicanus]